MRKLFRAFSRFNDWYVRECMNLEKPGLLRYEFWFDVVLIILMSLFLFAITEGIPFWRRATVTAMGPFFMFFMRLGLACQSLGYHFGKEKAEVMSRKFWGILSLITFVPPLIGTIMIIVTKS